MCAYAAGAAEAFDVLYGRHKAGVYRYLLHHCRNHGTADELFQDVWMNAIRARARYAPTARFATWLYALARNRLVDHWRSSGQVRLATIDDDADESAREKVESIPAPSHDQPEVRASARELGDRLRAALNALPAEQRDAFLLQQEGGLSLSEIGSLTGVGTETVKSRLRYAVSKLRSVLGPLREA